MVRKRHGMNVDMNQHNTQIALPDDAAKIRYEATVPGKATGPRPEAVVPCSTDPQPGVLPDQRKAAGSPAATGS